MRESYDFTSGKRGAVLFDAPRMRAQVLPQPTPSGDYLEVRFEADGDCTWVLFKPEDDDDWVGVFGRGGNDHDAVACDSVAEAFIIAGGRGYLIDTNQKTILHKTEDELFDEVVAGPNRGLFVIADNCHLYGYDADGQRWMTHRISWDGIRDLTLNGNRVTGMAWGLGDCWDEFELDLTTGCVTGAAYNGPDAYYPTPHDTRSHFDALRGWLAAIVRSAQNLVSRSGR